MICHQEKTLVTLFRLIKLFHLFLLYNKLNSAFHEHGLLILVFFLFLILLFILGGRETEHVHKQGRSRENPKQVLSYQHKAQRVPLSLESREQDLS